jgi:cardiolipin synthase
MRERFTDWIERLVANGLLLELFSIGGFILAVFMVARLMSEKRAPANTYAWLLGMLLLPWVGVPLYLFFGGRKLRRLAERKSAVQPALPAPAQNRRLRSLHGDRWRPEPGARIHGAGTVSQTLA